MSTSSLWRISFMFRERDDSAMAQILRLCSRVKAVNVEPFQEVTIVDESVASAGLGIFDFSGRSMVTSQDLREQLTAAGKSPGSSGYFAKRLCAAGILKKVGGATSGQWMVLPKNKTKAAPKKKAKQKPKNKTSERSK